MCNGNGLWLKFRILLLKILILCNKEFVENLVISFAAKFNFLLNYKIKRLEFIYSCYRLFKVLPLNYAFLKVFFSIILFVFFLVNDRILIYVICKSIFSLEFLLVINVFGELWRIFFLFSFFLSIIIF